MNLGAFSISLAVKDLAASRAFYEKLDFAVVGGDAEQNWLVLRNGTTTVGLFQGMFDANMLTFNPGWGVKDEHGKNEHLTSFDDVRDIQAQLKARGLTPEPEADPASTGTAYFMLTDPDGNPILIDQHVDRASG